MNDRIDLILSSLKIRLSCREEALNKMDDPRSSFHNTCAHKIIRELTTDLREIIEFIERTVTA